MSAGCIVMVAQGNTDAFPRQQAIRRAVAAALPERDVVLASALATDEPEAVGLLRGFDAARPSTAAGAAADAVRREFALEPAALYGADSAYVSGALSEAACVQRVLWILRRLQTLFASRSVDRVFMTGGGSLVSNTVFEYASRHTPARCFRYHPVHYLNLAPEQARYFFVDNNRRSLPAWPGVDTASERYRRACEDAARYVAAVREGRLRPDRFARAKARGGRFTPGFSGFAAALADTARFSLRAPFAPDHRRARARARALAYLRKTWLDVVRTPPDLDGDYFVLVLHHPKDSQLLLRARQFRDQVALCRLVASALPTGARLLVKEHPVYPGMLPIRDIRSLREAYPAVTFVDYSVPFEAVARRARAIVTLNSTAGLEAAIHGTPVVALGDGFYSDSDFVVRVSDPADLTASLSRLLVADARPRREQIEALLGRVFYHCEAAPSRDDRAIVACISGGIVERAGP